MSKFSRKKLYFNPIHKFNIPVQLWSPVLEVSSWYFIRLCFVEYFPAVKTDVKIWQRANIFLTHKIEPIYLRPVRLSTLKTASKLFQSLSQLFQLTLLLTIIIMLLWIFTFTFSLSCFHFHFFHFHLFTSIFNSCGFSLSHVALSTDPPPDHNHNVTAGFHFQLLAFIFYFHFFSYILLL